MQALAAAFATGTRQPSSRVGQRMFKEVSQFGKLELRTSIPTVVCRLQGSEQWVARSAAENNAAVALTPADADHALAAIRQAVVEVHAVGASSSEEAAEIVQRGCRVTLEASEPHPEDGRPALLTARVTLDESALSAAEAAALRLVVRLPFTHDVDVRAADENMNTAGPAAVRVEDMECDVTVRTESGHVHLAKIQSMTTRVESAEGSVTAASVQGNTTLATGGAGAVHARKLQGSQAAVRTQHGAVVLESLYMGESELRSESGALVLGDMHGNCSMTTDSGDIFVGTLDGNARLNSRSGACSISVSRAAAVEISTSAPARVALGNDLAATVLVTDAAADIRLDAATRARTSNEASGLRLVVGGGCEEGAESEGGKARTRVTMQSPVVVLEERDWAGTMMGNRKRLAEAAAAIGPDTRLFDVEL